MTATYILCILSVIIVQKINANTSSKISYISPTQIKNLGQSVELTCVGPVDSPVVWKTIDKKTNSDVIISIGQSIVLPGAKFSIRYEHAQSAYILKIRNISEIDAGVYQCVIPSNETDKESAEVELQVKIPPNILDNNTKSVTIEEGNVNANSSSKISYISPTQIKNLGQSVELTCAGPVDSPVIWKTIDKKTNSDVIISIGQSIVLPDAKFSIRYEHAQSAYILKIRNISEKDARVYQCVIPSIGTDKESAEVELKVKIPPNILDNSTEPVTIEEGNVNANSSSKISYISPTQIKNLGQSVELTCAGPVDSPVIWKTIDKKTNSDVIISIGQSIVLPDAKFSIKYEHAQSAYILKIRNISEKDAGVYQCEIPSIGTDKESAKVELQVKIPHNILYNSTKSVTIEEGNVNANSSSKISYISPTQIKNLGQSVELTCAGPVDSPVIWKTIDKKTNSDVIISIGQIIVLPDAKFSIRYEHAQSAYILKIRNISEKDAGVYQCVIPSIGTDKESAEVELKVKIPPNILDNSTKPVTIEEGNVNANSSSKILYISPIQIKNLGQSVELTCAGPVDSPVIWKTIDKKTNSDVIISIGQSIVLPDAKFSIRYEHAQSAYILKIRNISEKDAGVYQCEIPSIGTDKESAEVELQVKIPPNILYNSTKSVTIEEGNVNATSSSKISYISPTQIKNLGQSVELTCAGPVDFPVIWKTIDKKTNSDVIISIGQIIVLPDAKFSIRYEHAQSAYILKIRNISEKDAGVYQCVIPSIGTDKESAEVELKVKIPPNILDNSTKPVTIEEGNVNANSSSKILYISPTQIKNLGQSVELTCAGPVDSPVIWKTIDKKTNSDVIISIGQSIVLPDAKFSIRYEHAQSAYILKIRNISEKDAGVYQCEIPSIGTDKESAEVELQVKIPPNILYNSTKSVTIEEGNVNANSSSKISYISPTQIKNLGQSVELTCAGPVDSPVIWKTIDKKTNSDVIISIGQIIVLPDAKFSIRYEHAQSAYILKIRNISEKDAGVYQCVIPSIGTDKESAEVELKVKIPPNILDNSTKPVTIEEGNVNANSSSKISYISPTQIENLGQSVELTCATPVESQQDFVVIWKKIDKKPNSDMIISSGQFLVLPNSRFSIRYEPVQSAYILKIRNISEIDAGVYQCEIPSIGTNKESAEVELQVKIPPNILDNSTKSVTIEEGNDIKLECYAGGFPVPIISWRRENNEVLPTGGQIYKGNILTIKAINKNHRGTYYCIAENGVGTKAIRKIEVHIAFAPMIVVTQTSRGQVLHGQIELECDVEAFPPPVIKWEKENLTIHDDKHYRVSWFATTDEFVHTTLTVSSIEKEQYGQYICKAVNKLGSTQGKVNLFEVIPKPHEDALLSNSSTLISNSTTAILNNTAAMSKSTAL